VHDVDVRRLARDERADLAAFLATLTPQQWQAPTLCARWRVRDVVAHVISYDDLGARALLAVAARAGFRPGRINDTALTRYDRHTPGQLLALLAGNLQPAGSPAPPRTPSNASTPVPGAARARAEPAATGETPSPRQRCT